MDVTIATLAANLANISLTFNSTTSDCNVSAKVNETLYCNLLLSDTTATSAYSFLSSPSVSAQRFRYAVNRMEVYWNPLVIFLGIVGNMTSFIVFVCSPLRRMSWAVYLAALALSDSGFLIVLLASWMNHVGIKIYHRSGWCQALTYVTYVSAFLSVWYVSVRSIYAWDNLILSLFRGNYLEIDSRFKRDVYD